VLALATGRASKLLVTDREVLRKMRHADKEVRVPQPTDARPIVAKNGNSGAH